MYNDLWSKLIHWICTKYSILSYKRKKVWLLSSGIAFSLIIGAVKYRHSERALNRSYCRNLKQITWGQSNNIFILQKRAAKKDRCSLLLAKRTSVFFRKFLPRRRCSFVFPLRLSIAHLLINRHKLKSRCYYLLVIDCWSDINVFANWTDLNILLIPK